MSANISLVQLVEIASPCTASWDEMAGDDKSRFCSHCKLNVYNFAEMTSSEAERLIIEKEGRLCARIYRRFDGTVITRDCPIGLAAVRRAAMRAGLRTAAALLVLAAAAWKVLASSDESAGGQRTFFNGMEWVQRAPNIFDRMRTTLTRWMDESPPIPLAGSIMIQPSGNGSQAASSD